MKIAVLWLVLAMPVFSQAALADETTTTKPWSLRYAIFADTENWYQARVDAWKDNPRKYTRLQGFIPATFFKAGGAKERLAVLRIDFDLNGAVLTKTLNDVPLLGMLTSTNRLEFVTPHSFSPKWLINTSSYIGAHSTDIPGEGSEWEDGRMTFCDHRGTERLQAEMINEVDGPIIKIKLEPEEGIFYCNDWSRQLANPRRPWIDVTSYEKRGPRVRKFQGFGLFGVTKPVLGKHFKTWICFADCPDGKPGPIADIKVWSKQHGLPVEDRNFGM